jgi:drug/metabolite transporter (DMT)-like permease
MSPRAWAAFGAVATLWGIPYLFIKIAVDDGMPPAFLAWARVAMAAVVLLGFAWRAGLLPTLRGHGRAVVAYAVFEIAIPFPLIAAGEKHVASSLAAILIATVPLIIALLALRFDRAERVAGRRLAGLFIGLGGVVALVGIDVSGKPDELLGAGAILLAAVGYAIGPMILKRHMAMLDPRAAMAASLSVAAVVLTPAAIATPPTAAPSTAALVAVLVLGLFCTAAAFVFFGALVGEVGPSRASVITYVAPVVAVALGVTVLGERPGAGAVAGLLLILAGSWLSTGGRVPPGRRERVPETGVQPASRRSASRFMASARAAAAAASRSSARSAGRSTSTRRRVAMSLNASSSSAERTSAAENRDVSPLRALASAASRVPWRWRIAAADFSPMPLAPGMPSEGSPRSAMKSGTCSGSTP